MATHETRTHVVYYLCDNTNIRLRHQCKTENPTASRQSRRIGNTALLLLLSPPSFPAPAANPFACGHTQQPRASMPSAPEPAAPASEAATATEAREATEAAAAATSKSGDGQPAATATAGDAPATTATQNGNNDDDDDEDARCPICAFVSAGPCAQPHAEWSACRKAHREDFVDACKPLFVAFFRCMTATPESAGYHAPLLRAFGAPAPPGAGAAAAAAGEEQEEGQEDKGGAGAGEGAGGEAGAAATAVGGSSNNESGDDKS